MTGRLFFAFNLLFFTFFSYPTHAVAVDDLYRVTVTLQSRDKAARLDAMNRALRDVLVKVSGSRGILSRINPVYSTEQEEELMHLVDRFEYNKQASVPGAGISHHNLTVRFVPEAITHLLKEAGITMWSKNRPLVLLWLGLQAGKHQRFINQEQYAEAYELIERHAQQRGLPVLFPSLDLDDLRNMPFNALNPFNARAANHASQRYAPNAVLVAHINQHGSQWNATWNLLNQEQQINWERSGVDLSALLREGIDTLGDTLAAHYSRQSRAPSSAFVLRVIAVNGLRDYAKVQQYLNNLDMVTSWRLKTLDPEKLELDVEAYGGADGFSRSVALERILVPVEQGSGGNILSYRLLAY